MELLQALVTYFTVLVNILILAAPIVFGGYFAFFAKRLSLDMFRYRESVWSWGYTDFDLRFEEFFVRIVGMVILVGGLIFAWQTLLGGR